MGIIKKQSLQSSVFIYLGFLVGAVNIFFLFPKFTLGEFGLTRVLFAAAATLTSLSLLGMNRIMIKFYPFYQSHLKKEKSDFLTLSFLIPLIGFVLFTALAILFREKLFTIYSKKSALFLDYFYYVFPAAFSLLIFTILETYSQNLLKSVLANILKELGYRIFISLAIVLYILKLFDFKWFMVLFSSYYFLASFIMFVSIRRMGHLYFSFTFSRLTARMKGRMIRYGTFMFGGSVVSIVAENLDTFMIAGISGLENTAVFAVASYISVLLRVPQRGITGIVMPVISNAWREKNHAIIDKIYKGSSINLMVLSSVIFLLIWTNIDLIYSFLPAGYESGKMVVLIMSLTVIIDLGMGVNAEILITSSSWKVFFYTHVLLLALSIPANYFLIRHLGIIGSALSNLIAFTGYNLYRYIYIKKKYGLDPFSVNTIKWLLICVVSYFVTTQLNFFDNLFAAGILKSVALGILLGGSLIYFKISEDINMAFERFSGKYLRRSK